MSFKYGLESIGFFIDLKNCILLILYAFAQKNDPDTV